MTAAPNHRVELNDSSGDVLIAALQLWQSDIWTALPGIVQAVNLAEETVDVQVAVKMTQTDKMGVETQISVPKLIHCPIAFPSGGGFLLALPIAAGDEVLIIIASRCVDGWWDNGGEQPQLEFRMHDLSDGFVIPGIRSRPRARSGLSSANVQLRKDDGTALLEITPSGNINITTTGNVNVTAGGNAAVTATGNLDLESSATLTLQAPNISILGDVSSTGTFSNNGKAIGSTHYHTAQGATANTTTPKPP